MAHRTLRLTLELGDTVITDEMPEFKPQWKEARLVTAPEELLLSQIVRREVVGYAEDMHRLLSDG